MSPSSGTANKPEKLKTLSPPIHSLLSRLRSRIRAYVLFEGIAIAIIWLILMFWIALALDYLPVLFGFSELSQIARAIILGITAVLIGWVLYRFVLRRIFVRMHANRCRVICARCRSCQRNQLKTTQTKRVYCWIAAVKRRRSRDRKSWCNQTCGPTDLLAGQVGLASKLSA